MLRTIKRASALTAVFLAMAAGSARAEELTAKVPFSFVVRGKTLPAGTYRLEAVGDANAVMSIRNDDIHSNANAVVLTNPEGRQDPLGDKPALTFVRYENEYRLASVWSSQTEGRTVVGSLPRAAQSASAENTATTVIAANVN